MINIITKAQFHLVGLGLLNQIIYNWTPDWNTANIYITFLV